MGKFKNLLRADGGVELTSSNPAPHPGESTNPFRLSGSNKVWTPVRQEPDSRQGTTWSRAAALGHMCCPPHVFPEGWGPGSQYVCPGCGCAWQAEGLMNRSDEYRPYVDGTKMLFGPRQWFCIDFPQSMQTPSGEGIANIKLQESLYDWRDPGDIISGQMEELIQLVRSRGV